MNEYDLSDAVTETVAGALYNIQGNARINLACFKKNRSRALQQKLTYMYVLCQQKPENSEYVCLFAL